GPHRYILTPEKVKDANLVHLIHKLRPARRPVHHDLHQHLQFKSSVFKILIATDVASRGLDIPTVQVVINHNTPGLSKIYIHRVGRTASASQTEGVSCGGEILKILTQINVARRKCEIDPDLEAKRKAELDKIR
ncbi:unnamed protein product, partial [Coregonus sp. 'balchen']